MPSAAGYTWPDELDATIRREAAAAHVPLAWAYAFIAAESGFNPNAGNVSNIESSHGLLQLNAAGGQGTGYSLDALRDPATNLRIGLPYIARALLASFEIGMSDYDLVYLVATRSGHPGQVPPQDPRIHTIYDRFIDFSNVFPEPFPEPPPPLSVPPPGALPSDKVIKGLIAAAFVLSIGRPLSDLSAEDRAACQYVGANA